MRRRFALGGLAALLALAACDAAASPTAPSRTALPAGEYRSSAFSPPVTYRLPDGWLIAGDATDYFALQPVTSDIVGIYLFRSPLPASQDPACPTTAEPGVGTTARELVDWIRGRPGLVVSEPASVTVGGLVGFRIDVAIVAGWTLSCPFANGLPTVPLFVSAASQGFRWVVAGSERLRLDVLDVLGGGTVVVDIDAFEGSLMDTFLPAAIPVVETMRFGAP